MTDQGRLFKETGLDSVEAHNRAFMKWARDFALAHCNEHGYVSIDDVRLAAERLDKEPAHQNAWGAIFRGPRWKVIGRIKSRIPSNHAREIKVWAYDDGR